MVSLALFDRAVVVQKSSEGQLPGRTDLVSGDVLWNLLHWLLISEGFQRWLQLEIVLYEVLLRWPTLAFCTTPFLPPECFYCLSK